MKNPATGEMERKQVRIRKMKLVSERRKYVKRIVKELNEKLSNGWNPYLEAVAPKGFHLLVDTFDIFKNGLNKMYVINFSHTNARDFLNSEYEKPNVSEIYSAFKDLIPLLFGYLGFCFQRKASYMNSLKELWRNLIVAINVVF